MDQPYPNGLICSLFLLEYTSERLGSIPFLPGGSMRGYSYEKEPSKLSTSKLGCSEVAVRSGPKL